MVLSEKKTSTPSKSKWDSDTALNFEFPAISTTHFGNGEYETHRALNAARECCQWHDHLHIYYSNKSRWCFITSSVLCAVLNEQLKIHKYLYTLLTTVKTSITTACLPSPARRAGIVAIICLIWLHISTVRRKHTLIIKYFCLDEDKLFTNCRRLYNGTTALYRHFMISFTCLFFLDQSMERCLELCQSWLALRFVSLHHLYYISGR